MTRPSAARTRAVRLGLQLAWGSAPAQRLRAISVAAATLIGVVLMLAVAGIAHSEYVQNPQDYYPGAPGKRLLLAVVIAVGLPVIVLASSVARLSADLRDRRMANLRMLGMTRAGVRALAAIEVGITSLVGALLGSVAYVPMRHIIARLTVAQRSWPLSTLWPPLSAWVAVLLGLPLIVMGISALPARVRMDDALSKARLADRARPRWWRVAPLALGTVCCLYAQWRSDPAHGDRKDVIAAFFAGCGLLALGVILVVPVFVRLLADVLTRMSSRPTLRVAARRMQSQPAAVTRVIAGLLIGLFAVIGARAVVTAFESLQQYQDARYALTQRQVVTVTASSTDAARTLRAARSISEVGDVFAWPQMQSKCADSDDPCFAVAVASCQQVHAVDPDLRGCVAGKPFVLSKFGLDPSTHRLPPVYSSSADTQAAIDASTVRLPQDWSTPQNPPGSPAILHLEAMGIEAVVPPTLPGVSAATRHTNQLIVATAAPGRHLAEAMAALDVNGFAQGADFGFYDMVRAMRVMVYAIAAVILAVGLLAFAIAAIDRAVSRGREVASLQLVGVPRRILRRTQWIESAVPLALGSVLATGFGAMAGATYLALGSFDRGFPWAGSSLIALSAVVGACAVGGLTVIAANPRISPDLIRRE